MTWKAVAEGVEALKKAKGKRKAFQIETYKMRKEGEVTEAKLKGAKQENSQFKKEIEELRARLAAQKKKIEQLQASFATQKKELEGGFVAQKKELEAEYQK